jgi:hypothetical protein
VAEDKKLLRDLDGECRRCRRGGVSLSIVILGVLLIGLSGCGDLSRDELNRGVQSLGALAAQGQLVANGVARDATKSTYTRVMAKTLGGEAQHEAEKLADAEPSPEVSEERNAAVTLAGDLSDAYSVLQTFPGNEQRGEMTEKQMSELKDRADAISARLDRVPAQ